MYTAVTTLINGQVRWVIKKANGNLVTIDGKKLNFIKQSEAKKYIKTVEGK